MKKQILCLFCVLAFCKIWAQGPIASIIGHEESPHPLIQELIDHPVMQRIKEIDQSGAARYFLNLPAFQRYEHCVGVYMLLHRFNAPFDACVAGLLHDVSHTVFSHVADFLFRGADLAHSYQDQIHLWYLEQRSIAGLLSEYSLDLQDVDPERYHILDQPLPDLCADRIEYNLHTAYLWGILSQDEVEQILQALCYRDGIWFFLSQDAASRFAALPLHFNVTLWGSRDNLIIYYWTSLALKRALEIGAISFDEIHFSIDRAVLDKLITSVDSEIRGYMQKCTSFEDCYIETSAELADLHIPIKFRGIDPLVMTEKGLKRLTALDPEFEKRWNEVKAFAQKGHHLKFKEN